MPEREGRSGLNEGYYHRQAQKSSARARAVFKRQQSNIPGFSRKERCSQLHLLYAPETNPTDDFLRELRSCTL